MEINVSYRLATINDLEPLVDIEQACFEQDRLSKRSMRRWIKSEHGLLLVVAHEQQLVGYGLVWCHKGTRLARLYSLAVINQWRGHGLARNILFKLEQLASDQGRLYMRLEVEKTNHAAIRLYENVGYRIFGEHLNYYENHSDALRMQKKIKLPADKQILRATPWYQQTTEFTCGPAALIMAMASLDSRIKVSQSLELDLWREATTIFMTSGHGGCHPIGLALSANQRGFAASVYLNIQGTLFIDSVRSENKKHILGVVHQQFVDRAGQESVEIIYEEISQQQVEKWLQQGYAVLILISTFRLDGKKAPHWVTITGIDDRCLYVHDPDLDEKSHLAIDCQHLPIAREDFDKMSAFGTGRLRTAVAIRPKN